MSDRTAPMRCAPSDPAAPRGCNPSARPCASQPAPASWLIAQFPAPLTGHLPHPEPLRCARSRPRGGAARGHSPAPLTGHSLTGHVRFSLLRLGGLRKAQGWQAQAPMPGRHGSPDQRKGLM
ncbi:hypothetical protein GCM10009801_45160 [Streptomyces albiaxialis]|uniref:Uncharacterized protein n=1 Tax=Streptomyces albiaxialis TaxID=329523 RepID=A0ABN2W5D3_9ACTN